MLGIRVPEDYIEMCAPLEISISGGGSQKLLLNLPRDSDAYSGLETVLGSSIGIWW